MFCMTHSSFEHGMHGKILPPSAHVCSLHEFSKHLEVQKLLEIMLTQSAIAQHRYSKLRRTLAPPMTPVRY